LFGPDFLLRRVVVGVGPQLLVTFDQGNRNLWKFWAELGYAEVVSIEGGVAEAQDRVVEVGGPAESWEVSQDLVELPSEK
jgi:hypothetical protein